GLSLGVFEGDRVGLVGPNGSGKSTLLRILAGEETPDAGIVAARKGLRLGYVAQDASFDPELSVAEVVDAALAGERLAADERHARVYATLARAAFADPEQRAGTLSGGWTKRLAVACALVRSPDLLLMDEPTNHLDLEGILWLERLLRADAVAFMVISHDRYFLENVCGRIIELNRCYASGVLDAEGAYSDFLEQKDALLASQASYRDSLANRVRREIEWLKRGPKARTRKSSARIQQAADWQGELATVDGRAATRNARIEFTASERKTKRLLHADAIGVRFDARVLFDALTLTLSPGVRVGLLGPNGSGKTTLLRVLTGERAPDSGTVERAPDLRVVYMSQQREQMDAATTLRRALAPHGDQVVYQDRPIHIAGWARRFLFSAEQLDQPVSRLSGGERARVAIAQLMLQPADVVILDEPTNDLDIPTREVLEENLLELPGALVLVTHDRFMFDRVSTIVLALDGQGGWQTYADYAQWEAAQRQPAVAAAPKPTAAAAARATGAGKRLSYKKQREWDQMEASILAAETALTDCQAAVDDPAIAADAGLLAQRYRELQAAQDEVDRLFARWAELEAELAG
ncbi:MAG: ABC-F family ATP-binding cassette domain-containing protein, partial [Candidatus Binatia bacterium]